MFEPRQIIDQNSLMRDWFLLLRPTVSVNSTNPHIYRVDLIGEYAKVGVFIHKECQPHEVEALLTTLLLMYRDMVEIAKWSISCHPKAFVELLKYATGKAAFAYDTTPGLWVTNFPIPYRSPGFIPNQRGYVVENEMVRKLAIYAQGTNNGSRPFEGLIGTTTRVVQN